MDLMKLKSGSDIRGAALDGVPGRQNELTDETIERITRGFLIWLGKRTNGKSAMKIAAGRDSRLSGERISAAVIRTLVSAGCIVYDCGLCSTPSIFMMTQYPETNCDAGIMITASHHPYYLNGLKFFTKAGGAESGDISEILNGAAAGVEIAALGGKLVQDDYMVLYSGRFLGLVRKATGEQKPLAGLKIAVDAGNGAGGFYADVLSGLGADVSGSQFLEPDGHFPNHVPNPEDAAAMESISRRIKECKADLGIIFDTDVDRAAIVDGNGAEINRNRLIALIAGILLEEQPGATIVTDSVTSDGLHEFILQRGGKHHRFKRGYKNVINEAIRLEQKGISAPLAIETSGHAALKENYFLDDGAYLVTRILIKMCLLNKQGKNLFDIIKTHKTPLEEAEARALLKTAGYKEQGAKIIADVAAIAEKRFRVSPDNYEGIRANVDGSQGFFLLRMSVHDPVMPINIESDTLGGVKEIAAILVEILSAYDFLDISALRALTVDD